MHGCIRRLGWLWMLPLAIGCSEARPEIVLTPPTELAGDFAAESCGTIEGRVVWEGPAPKVAALTYAPYPFENPDYPKQARDFANPHAPQINGDNRGVGQAVVFLRKVDVARSKLWDHAGVRVDVSDWKLVVHQGATAGHVGFVRCGTTFEASRSQDKFHILQGGDRAFFSVPLADGSVVSQVRLKSPGHVELGSGAGYFWMRAHLFSCEHPYYCVSDEEGRFRLTQVPAGTYQVVCWLPNWQVAGRERYPESTQVNRLFFAAAAEQETSATVVAGQTSGVDFTWSEKQFVKKTQ